MSATNLPAAATLDELDHALPQTQCTRCGYPDCHSYAQAMAQQQADINRCPPGGDEGIQRLADLTQRPYLPLNPECGTEGPLRRAVIDEAWCIGCTLCLDACPVDAIIGANKWMHTVLPEQCTGCELCLPVCPVDCIQMEAPAFPEATGWSAWSAAQAQQARLRYQSHQRRLAKRVADQQTAQLAKAERKLAHLAEESKLQDPALLQQKRSLIESALARARARRRTDG